MDVERGVEPLRRQVTRIQPKLRMIANGDTPVNAIRAEMSSCVAVTDEMALATAPQMTGDALPKTRDDLGDAATPAKLQRLPEGVDVNVFIQTTQPDAEIEGLPRDARGKGNLIIARVPVADLPRIASNPNVSYVHVGDALAAPVPEIATTEPERPDPRRWRFGNVRAHHNGRRVLIGIVDVGGFDFSHPDFLRDETHTRFARIWDQGGEATPQRPPPRGFSYGKEIRSEQMDAALAAAASGEIRLPAWELEPQSRMEEGSHGTHVSSIAAGNRGICREAILVGVLVSLPQDDQERRKSFYDSTRVADAVDYLVQVAHELGEELNDGKGDLPLVINVSLGTNGHAHDGSAAISRWIDTTMVEPGRAICVAAGNAGQEVATFEGDLGYVTGRVHTSGRVPGRGLSVDIDWVVVGNTRVDVSENELEVWYGAQDRFAVSLRPPGSPTWIGPVGPREYVENQQLPGGSFVSIYNEAYHPSNGVNYISIYLSPMFSPEGVIGIPAGQWTVRLKGVDIHDGRYHAWIERDDPRRQGRVGERDRWRFPSFFSERSNVDDSSVSSLACGQRVISVGNLDHVAERMAITSSQGPTRDGRFKPDVAAPGTGILAARGFSDRSQPWVAMSGTSMASPYVAGVVGLMFGVQPALTAAQVEGIIQRTAQPLPGTDFSWSNAAGFGRIDPDGCLEEAARLHERTDLTR
jgi:subtilisin family serine protease